MIVGGRDLSTGPCLVVAEVGINHDGNETTLMRFPRVARDAGANALKIQCFSADCFVDKTATWLGQSQYDLFKRHELSRDAVMRVAEECRRQEIMFLGTPDCEAHAQWLVDAGAVALKIGSDDLTNTPLVSRIAEFGLPMIISTGMSERLEVTEAYRAAWTRSVANIALMYCCSVYPARLRHLRLKRLKELFNIGMDVVGFSDHTQDSTASAIAVSHGVKIVEKHLTLSHLSAGPDHWWSADPIEFALLVNTIRETEEALTGTQLSDEEKSMRLIARRNTFALTDIHEGERLTEVNVHFMRSMDRGVPPGRAIMRVANRSVKAGELLTEADLR